MKVNLIMPSEGDMALIDQEGGRIALSPIFYGAESMGPHIEVRDDEDKLISRSRLKVKKDGKVEIKKGEIA